MRMSNRIKAEDIADFYYQDQVKIGGRWYVSKPKGFSCLCFFKRLKLAWQVFIGRVDTLEYKEDQEKKSKVKIKVKGKQ